jgi:hypothetical protein
MQPTYREQVPESFGKPQKRWRIRMKQTETDNKTQRRSAGKTVGDNMNMPQTAREASQGEFGNTAQSNAQHAGCIIEATSHCRNGKLPRWSFLIQGIGGSTRHSMIGTDEQGRGLYLYASAGQSSTRQQLIAPSDLSLPDSLSRHQANDEIMKLLEKLDWNDPRFAPKPEAPRFKPYAVS